MCKTFLQGYNRYSYVINNPLKYIDPTGENWFSDAWNWVKDTWNDGWGAINGTPNPETGQYEGGLAQQVLGWVPDGIGFGVNSSGQTFHYTNNGAPVYHHYNAMATPGINWAEVNAARELEARMTAFWNDQVGGYDYEPEVASSQGGGPGWEAYAGAAASVGSEMFYSKTYGTWMGKNFKMYKQTWGGNGFTGGKNKFGKSTSNSIKWAGRIVGLYSGYKTIDQRINGEIGTGWMLAELGTTGVSTFGGLYGAAWGVGWELGRAVTTLDAYQEFKFNFWYDRWESKVGPPSQSNEGAWYYFYNNYGQ